MSCWKLGNPAIKPTSQKPDLSAQQNCDKQRDTKTMAKTKHRAQPKSLS
jgi:hypothetical protein